MLRWGYDELRRRLRAHRPDVLVVHAPHWITMVGHHVNCVPHPRGVSVEPIFPHLFRYHYDFSTDVELAEAIVDEAEHGPGHQRDARTDVRIDYATIGALHLANPSGTSRSCRSRPTTTRTSTPTPRSTRWRSWARRPAGRSSGTGRRAVLLGSNSLSHLHWEVEPELPEDMSREHPFDQHQYEWDMRAAARPMREGPTSRLRELIPRHIEATSSETKAGSLSWLLAAMGWPDIAGDVLAYGTVIGTGNALVEWGEDVADLRAAALVPGMPHMLSPDPAPSWARLGDAVREPGTACAPPGSGPC